MKRDLHSRKYTFILVNANVIFLAKFSFNTLAFPLHRLFAFFIAVC